MAPRRGVMSISASSNMTIGEGSPLDRWRTPVVEMDLVDTGNCVHDGSYYRVAGRNTPMIPF